MKQARVHRVGRHLFVCWASAAWLVALGQPLQDPTRPPPDRLPPAPSTGRPGAPDAQKIDSQSGLRLVLSGAHRRVALLDGQLMSLGGELAGTRLVAVSADQAVLERSGQREALSLHPQVLKLARPTAHHTRTPSSDPPREPLKNSVRP